MVILSGLLSVMMAGAFALFVAAIVDLRDSARLADRSEAALASANRLERLVVDLETGARGYIITSDKRFLHPWTTARSGFTEAARLRRLAAANSPDQGKRADQIGQAAASYIRDFSVPLVATAQRDPRAARAIVATAEAKRRFDAIRAQSDRFVNIEHTIAATHERCSMAAARRATIIAAAGALGSLLLIFLLVGYLTRAIVRPVRRLAAMAGHLAAGDLTVRIPETSAGEIRMLESAFNAMACSLETSCDKLREMADEQGALRRVATLIARGASPPEVFGAVAREKGRLLEADYTLVNRFETDHTTTVVGHWSDPCAPDIMPPLDGHWPVEDDTLEARVLRTGEPAGWTSHGPASGEIAVWARSHGIHYAVACPVIIEGRVWGTVTALFLASEPPPGAEEGILEFVELVSTAIASAESRAQLLASRARVGAASDATRRRIERNLHDGAQQRLVSLALQLRAAEAAVPPQEEELKERLADAARGLTGVLEELQEISRGLHPAILSKGGLAPALKALARRSPIPVELNVYAGRRLAEQLEVAIYYIVSEALTNAIKHAHATRVRIDVYVEDEVVRLSIDDDGVGGADFAGGSGLIGLKDRIEALGGAIQVHSPTGQGTSLLIKIPVEPA